MQPLEKRNFFVKGSGSWTADEQSVCKMVLTECLLISNYTVDYSSMPEKVKQNLNICLFLGVKPTSPHEPGRDVALSRSPEKRMK